MSSSSQNPSQNPSQNFKPGDRAIIIRAAAPQNIGKIVEIVQQIQVGDLQSIAGTEVVYWPQTKSGKHWQIEALSGSLTAVFHGMYGEPDRFVQTSTSGIPEPCLRKLPDPDDLQKDDIIDEVVEILETLPNNL